MGTFGSKLRDASENQYPPPDYEPDGDSITISFHLGGHIEEGVYYGEGPEVKCLKYDYVPVKMLGVGAMRLFARKQLNSDEFNLYLKDRTGLTSLTEDRQLFSAVEKLENVRECFICIVLKSAIRGDVGEVVEDTDGDDSLNGVSDFSDSDEEYEYDMAESEESDDSWMENVFLEETTTTGQSTVRRSKGKEKVSYHGEVGAGAEQEFDDDSGDDECVNESDEDLNTARDSDDESYNRLNCQTFNQVNMFQSNICLGMIFTSKKELKLAIQSMAINEQRNVNFPKNDHQRLWAECAVKECEWMIRGLKLKNETAFQISKYVEPHTCMPQFIVKNVTSTWLADKYLDIFRNDPKRDLDAFRTETMKNLKVNISEHQMIKAKRKALTIIEGKQDSQYELLYSFVEELKRSNPGSSIELVVDGSEGRRIFDRLYICLNACKSGFKEGCRPVLCFDGCWLKGITGGCLLTAVGIDANNGYLPIAWAVVPKECTETWSWFFRHVKMDLQVVQTNYYTLMSDKQKGLIQAEMDEFPGAEYRFCARHLLVNFQNAGFRGAELKKHFWTAAKSTTINKFEVVMDKIHKIEPRAEQWLRDRPPSQWCRAFFREFARCDILTNNACELFNGNIRKARERPIVTMLEMIHEHIMKRFAKNRDKAEKSKRWQEILCPKIQMFIDHHTCKMQDWIPMKADNDNFSIKGMYGGQYHVDLKAGSCACKKWQLSGYPCIHAQPAITFQQADVERFTHKCYEVSTYKKIYKHCVYPMNSRDEWPRTNMLPIGPPTYLRRRAGRPVIRRRLEQGEMHLGGRQKKQKPLIITCSSGHKQLRRQESCSKCKRCGTAGHNVRTCKNVTAPSLGNHEEEEIIDLTVGNIPADPQDTQPDQIVTNPAEDVTVSVDVQPVDELVHSATTGGLEELIHEQHDYHAPPVFLQSMIQENPINFTEVPLPAGNPDANVSSSDVPIITKGGKKYMTLKNVVAGGMDKDKGH